MLSTILNAFQVADIRKKIAFTAVMLLIYRLGSHVPVPGVNLTAVNNIQKSVRRLRHPQLPEPVLRRRALANSRSSRWGSCPTSPPRSSCSCCRWRCPSLEKLSKEGEVGQARITQYTRYLTVGLAFAQSIGYVFLFHTLQAKAGENRSSPTSTCRTSS